ncbi:unnamed protein product, partial [Iphiclides podalirius]
MLWVNQNNLNNLNNASSIVTPIFRINIALDHELFGIEGQLSLSLAAPVLSRVPMANKVDIVIGAQRAPCYESIRLAGRAPCRANRPPDPIELLAPTRR